jgi:hypothetical protein
LYPKTTIHQKPFQGSFDNWPPTNENETDNELDVLFAWSITANPGGLVAF